MRYIVGAILLSLAFLASPAKAQDALVVQTCGTLPLAYAPGATRLVTVDTTGKLCSSGGSGGLAAGAAITGCTANLILFNSSTNTLACTDTQFMLSPSGTTANPGLGGGADPTTGFSWPGAGKLVFSSAGVQKFDYNVTTAGFLTFQSGIALTAGSQIRIGNAAGSSGLQFVGAAGALNTIGTLAASETIQFRVASVAQMLLEGGAGGLIAIGPAVTAAATFPALKRVTTTLAVRLADDSADAPISASSGTFSGALNATLAAATGTNVVCNTPGAATALTVQVFATGCVASDADIKQNIRPIDPNTAFDIVMAMRPVQYEYRPEERMGDDEHVGFTAQQIASITTTIPGYDMITRRDDGHPHAVKYNEMVPLLVAAMQQMKADFEAYKREHP